MGFIDASFFLTGLTEAAAGAGIVFPKFEAGENELWLDDVKLTDEQPSPTADLLTDDGGSVPDFLSLFGTAASIARLPSGLAGKPCWQIRYSLGQREIAGLFRGVGTGALAGSAGLHVSLQVSAHTLLAVQVKERDGSEYTTVLDLPPGRIEDRELPWPDFRQGDNSTDENGRLDVDQIREVNVLDATNAFGGGGPHDNELLLGPLVPST